MRDDTERFVIRTTVRLTRHAFWERTYGRERESDRETGDEEALG